MLKGVRSRLMKRVLKNPVAVVALVVILVAEETFLAAEVGGEDVETTSWLKAHLRPAVKAIVFREREMKS